MNTRSGDTSEATSVATRRSERCSAASRLISASLAPGSTGSARSPDSWRGARSVRSIPVVTSDSWAPSSSAIGRFDQAMSRRPPSFVIQWPTWGLDVRAVQT